jgi:hypothetical protein
MSPVKTQMAPDTRLTAEQQTNLQSSYRLLTEGEF